MATGKLGPRIGVGRTAEIFAWGPDQVLKLIRPEFPTRLADEEAATTEAVRNAGISAPAVEGVVVLGGRRGILFQRVNGAMLINLLRARPWLLRRMADLFADPHRSLHAHVAPPRLPPLRPRLEERIRNLAIPLGRSEWRDLRDAVLAALSRLPDGEALCHGDLHPGNVIMSVQGPVIIDWNDASRGHPLADVARSVMLLRHSALPPEMGFLTRGLLQTIRRAFTTRYLDGYLGERPAAEEEMTAWLPAIAAARIGEGIPGEQAHLLALMKGPSP